jgi:signal transduction histidine kinase
LINEEQRKFLARVKTGAERVVHMTNDLIGEAAGEEQWLAPKRQEVDVGKLIEGAIAKSCVQLEDKDLKLDLALAQDLPAIKADPDYLRRVLINLLSNACLASLEGGEIQVWAGQSDGLPFEQDQAELNGDGFVIISVRDAGGGLSGDALNRVFDRARPSQTPSGLGESGAGLALVKTLVEAHGGRLWVESEQGVGTTFSFVLPVNERERRVLDGQRRDSAG